MNKVQTDPKWRSFEKAVAEFVQALDSEAEVKHDIRLPDRHSKRPRQRDVWIEAKLFKHFPVSILVSCKLLKRKIHQQDMDAFNGELISSGAHKGVIYSLAGYTKPALEKAKDLGICCCKLYKNDKPDLPENLILYTYCCTPKFSVKFLEPPDSGWNISNYGDLFSLEVDIASKKISMLDAIDLKYIESEKTSTEHGKKRKFPCDWKNEITLSDTESDIRPLRIQLAGAWNIYRAKLEAHLLNGSYSYTTGQFIGNQSTPWIDTQGSHPGPGWELLDQRPTETNPTCVVSFLSGSIKEILKKNMGKVSLKI